MSENFDPNFNYENNSTPNLQNTPIHPPGHFTMREATPEETGQSNTNGITENTQGENTQRNEYTPSSSGYTSPANGLTPPPSGYTPPSSGYNSPSSGYTPSSNGLTPPSSGYTPPDQQNPSSPRYAQSAYTGEPPRYSTSNGWQRPDDQDKPPSKKKRGLKTFGIVAVSVFAVALVTFAGIGVVNVINQNLMNNDLSDSSQSEPSLQVPAGSLPGINLQDRPQTDAVQLPGGVLSTQQIVKKVEPSVVAITTYLNIQNYQASGMGSGIIMSEDGYVVTNAHVVEGAQGITVQMSDGESYEGRLVAADSKTDLAVLKIDATGLVPAEFGNSEQIEVGEKVLAIGNPQSMEFYGSVTQGIVSGLDRKIVAQDASTGQTTSYSNLIQTDAAINPGNSGGALVNEFGQVIGINSAKVIASGSEGMGFAIPANEVKPIVDDLIQNGYVTGRVRLGITAYPVNEALAQMNGAKPGLFVQATEEGSDISRQGVVPGDIITAVDGTKIENVEDLTAQLSGKKPGDTVVLSIFRTPSRSGQQKREFDVTITLLEDKGQTGSVPQQQQEQIPQQDQYSQDEINDFFDQFFR